MHTAHKFGLPSVAGMAHCARGYLEIGESVMGFAPNCDYRFRSQSVQQPREERPASFAFLPGMATIRHWIVRSVGVQREDVPQKDRAPQFFYHRPNHGRCSLSDRRSFSCPSQLWRSEKLCMCREVNVVRQRKASATAAAVAKVPSDPNGIYAALHSGMKNDRQIATANGRSICAVVAIARVGVGIENGVEP